MDRKILNVRMLRYVKRLEISLSCCVLSISTAQTAWPPAVTWQSARIWSLPSTCLCFNQHTVPLWHSICEYCIGTLHTRARTHTHTHIQNSWCNSPKRDVVTSFSRFLDHTQLHATVCRTSLDERSASRKDFYLTTLKKRQTFMLPRDANPKSSQVCWMLYIILQN